MTVKIISQTKKQLTFQVTIDLEGSMLEMEEKILESLNEVGRVATAEGLKKFDTDGSSIQLGSVKLTSRSQNNEEYQTPYGSIEIKRHVYQTSQGGKIYCPLEANARIIQGATPRFAKMLSNKYARLAAPEVVDDMENNHGRHISLRYLQTVSEAVAAIAQAKEESWEYQTPELEEPVKTISISMDGAYVLMHQDGYREAMVGSISLYDSEGERQHTIYVGASPEYGKDLFKSRMEREIEHIKKLYPTAKYLGIADGAKNNWNFLKLHTSTQLIDFYHVTEYLSKTAEAAYPAKTGKRERTQWLEERCHQLKHDKGAALSILEELKQYRQKQKLRKEVMESLEAAITYFENNHEMMNYHKHVKKKLPIGSGVTEAACKTLIKQRFCRSGMRWKDKGMKIVLSLRQLIQSGNRWKQFWSKINQYGASAVA
jgi:hypothetical protein